MSKKKLENPRQVYVYLDGETRSEADIKKVGGYKYLCHPSTDLICFCFAVGKEDVQLVTRKDLDQENDTFAGGTDDLNDLYDLAVDPEVIFIAHNAFFEQVWWQKIMVERYNFPPIPRERWQCTMAKAYSYGLPGALKNVAKALKLTFQKDMEGRENMLKLSKPRKNGEFWEYADCPEDFEKCYLYCGQDIEVMRELDQTLRDLIPKEQAIWVIDQRMNQQGILVDLPLIEKAITWIERSKEEALAQFQEAVGQDLKPTQRAKLIAWLKENGVEVQNTQAATIEALLEAGGLPENVEIALSLCTSGGKSSLAKYPAMRDRADEFGIVRENLAYHAAHTGRWGGRGIQPQNYVRPTINMDLVCGALEDLEYESFQLLFG